MKRGLPCSPYSGYYFALCFFIISFITNHAFAQNLLTNGDFESGGSGVGFQVQAPYVVDPTPGSSVPGNYLITTDPYLMNNTYFNHGTDHTTGNGNMLVVDGTTTGGQQRFWKAGSTGGGVGPLTINTVTYIFSYWIKSVSSGDVDAATLANIGIAWNNASNVTLVSGSPAAGLPAAGWQQVVYTFTATNNYVNIELYDNNTNIAGNDFAIDDISVKAAPPPLSLLYSLINPTCPGSKDGSIVLYGHGGTPPYSYFFGGVANAGGILTGLGDTTLIIKITDAASLSVSANVTLKGPDSLKVKNDTTFCPGGAATLGVTGGLPPYTWSASPADPSLAGQVNIANPTVTPAQTTIYTVTSAIAAPKNLIYNGNFELGDKGFYSNYVSYSNPPTPSNPTGAQKSYSVTTNPRNMESGFILGTDHTSGTGNMFVADGSITISGNDTAWYQVVPVTPNTNYTFTYWAENVSNSAAAPLDVIFNGVSIGTFTPALSAVTDWQQFTYTWNSGINNTVKICLYDRSTLLGGNDFALDDISLTGPVITCALSAKQTVTVSPASSPVTGFSYASPVCANIQNISPTLNPGFTPGGTFTSVSPGLSVDPVTGVINVSTSNPGTYSVTYTFAGAGCTAAGSSTTGITITPLAALTLTSAPATTNQTVCINTAIVPITYRVNNATSAAITSGTLPAGVTGSYSSGVFTLSGTPSASGTFNYTITTSGGCGSASLSGTITVTTTATLTLTSAPATANQTICINSAIATITYSVSGGTGGSITSGSLPAGVTGSSSGGVFTISGTPTASGTFNYTLTNSGGCNNVSLNGTINVGSINTPAANVTQPTCTIPTGTIEVTSPTGNNIEYSISGSPYQAGNIFSGLAPNQNYTLTCTDRSSGCISTTVTITIDAIPTFHFDLTATATYINPLERVTLNTSSIEPYTVLQWLPSNFFLNQAATSQTIQPISTQTYTVYAQSSLGCIAYDTITIKVYTPGDDVFVPNAFTPNGDGINDILYVKGNLISDLEMRVFNQWGQEIFATTDKNIGWDGTSKGKAQAVGVYVYALRAYLSDGRIINKKGSVTLVR